MQLKDTCNSHHKNNRGDTITEIGHNYRDNDVTHINHISTLCTRSI